MIKNFLKKYTKLWGKIKDLIGKKIDSEPIYNDNYIKTKIKYTIMILEQIFTMKVITKSTKRRLLI